MNTIMYFNDVLIDSYFICEKSFLEIPFLSMKYQTMFYFVIYDIYL